MKPLLIGFFLSGLLLFAFEASGAEINGFVGYTSMQVAPNVTVKLINGKSGEVTDIDETSKLGVNPTMTVKLDDRHQEYITYHRDAVFEKNI